MKLSDSIDHAIQVAEDECEVANQRLNEVGKQYQELLADKVIADNQLLDLILKRKNLQ